MTKIISALALLAVLAAATSACSSNKVKAKVDSDSIRQMEEIVPTVADSLVDSLPADSISVSK